MLLEEAVVVSLATLVVADEPGAVTEGEADAPRLVVVVAVSLAAVVVAADWAEADGDDSSSRHRAEPRRV